MLCLLPLGFIKQQIFSRPRNYSEGLVARKLCYYIGSAAGAVDKIFTAELLTVFCLDGKIAVILCYFANVKIAFEGCAVVHGVSHGRNGKLIRRNYGGAA